MVDWKEHIVASLDTLSGRPRIKGTRIGVALLLDRLADGWSEADIVASYPNITQEDLRAVFGFARDCIQEKALPGDLCTPQA